MKRIFRIVALVLALVLLLSISVFAADPTVTPKKESVTAAFNEAKDQITVTVSGLTEEKQYAVIMVKGTETSYTVDETSIRYIDQKAADAEGKISFTVYPSKMENGVILVTGEDIAVPVAAIVDGMIRLGDVNEDGKINQVDALQVLRHFAKLSKLDDNQAKAGDVNEDGKLNQVDALQILRYFAGIISGF